MERLKRKQLQQLRLQKEQQALQLKHALRQMIKSEQSMEIMLRFAEQFLRNGNMQALAEYSPTQISRLVFDRQLQLIKNQFQRLPGRQAKLEHFVIVMIRVMAFPFEKSPFYMVGLKDMFYQIAQEGKETVDYSSFFRYILGELVSIKEQEQNTEFQVQIQQRKKQDYLLHDNGIKRIRYSKDLRMVFSLDERDKTVKIYDHDMKHTAKYSAKKQKHANKFPFILDFDYSEISTRLGVIFSDDTLSTVHIPHLLTKTQAEFDLGALNETVFTLPEQMKYVFFIQMLNKWLTVSDTGLSLYLFDMERVRSQPEKVMTKLNINTNELKVNLVLQVVPLSCICIIAGNEVNFYNESLVMPKFNKFSHVDQIQHFKYSDEKNQFYLCGREKTITIFTIGRSGSASKIWTFLINKIITDFQVFPCFDTIVIADQNNEIRLMHESTRTIYQQVNYSHIVKSKDKGISIFKISKNQFSIYQTYQIVMAQEKIAIQRGIEYSFLPYFHVDHRKEELYISVNSQIIAFSLLSGQIRKNYSLDSSNLEKHFCFFVDSKTGLFVLDYEFNLYQLYSKEQLGEGENRSYKKKVNIEEVVSCFYDEDLQNLMIVGKNTMTQVRNDKNNNFNFVNGIFFEHFAAITRATFCRHTKTLTFLTSDQLLYQIKNYEHQIENCYKFIFPKDTKQHQEGLIINFHYDSCYELIILFTNKNQVYFVDKITGRQVYFNIEEHLPVKLKQHRFTNMRYQLIEEKKGFKQHYILITDQTGILIQFSLTKIYEQFQITSKQQSNIIKPMYKQTQIISNQGILVKQIYLNQTQKLKRSYTEVGLMKAHEKSIAIAIKIKLQIMTTLTISIDGYIRLWNDKYDQLFSLKIPSLLRLAWNMKQIQDIKNRKSINELLSLFDEHYKEAMQQHSSPVQIYNKSKRIKQKGETPRINLSDPIRIDIENKDIEQIVMQKPDYTHYSSPDKSKTHQFFQTTQKVYSHPWRTKRQFVKIYEKASPPHKYKQRIPQDLLEMRSSLDMTEKVREVLTYKEAELILPQLTFYQPQKSSPQKKKQQAKQLEPQQGQNFESCLYVKSVKRKKKINQFDQIDKQFKKKEMVLTARKWVPKKRKQRTNSVIQMKAETSGILNEGKPDPIGSIQKIFEEHNRECMQTKKGRLIKIPKINLNKDFY